MLNKCIHRVFFKENFMKKMLNKGWEPVYFKNIGCCIFKPCVARKYTCKLVFMNRKCQGNYNRLYNQINEIKKYGDIRIIELRDEDPTINFYYLIYDKEKKLPYEFNVYEGADTAKKITSKLIINCIGLFAYIFCFIFLCINGLLKGGRYWVWYALGLLGPICCIPYMITLIRQLIITIYIYLKFFKNK